MNIKKGSLSLSVNAIVVLILAVVMLGLGLGFVKGMFGKVSTSFEEAAGTEADAAVATGANPITLSRESLIVNNGDTVVMKFGIYNPSAVTWTSAEPVLECSPSLIATSPARQVTKSTLTSGQSATGTYLFNVANIAAGKYLCKIKVYAVLSGCTAGSASSPPATAAPHWFCTNLNVPASHCTASNVPPTPTCTGPNALANFFFTDVSKEIVVTVRK